MRYLCFDNGGQTADRYTVFYRESAWVPWSSALFLSEDCDSPMGVSIAGAAARPFLHPETMAHLGERVPLSLLPDRVRSHIYRRLEP